LRSIRLPDFEHTKCKVYGSNWKWLL